MAVKKLRAPSLTSSPGALAPYGAAIMAPSLGATDRSQARNLFIRLNSAHGVRLHQAEGIREFSGPRTKVAPFHPDSLFRWVAIVEPRSIP